MWQIPCKMTNSSSKPLQTLGKWYQPRNPKKNPKPAQKKIPKTISHPLVGPSSQEASIPLIYWSSNGNKTRLENKTWLAPERPRGRVVTAERQQKKLGLAPAKPSASACEATRQAKLRDLGAAPASAQARVGGYVINQGHIFRYLVPLATFLILSGVFFFFPPWAPWDCRFAWKQRRTCRWRDDRMRTLLYNIA